MGLAGCGVAAQPGREWQPRAGLGAFTGYAWSGAVHSLEARWRVPRVLGGPRRAVAATWIGAQGRGSAFIQVGTSEQRVGPAGGVRYFAFWSDPEHAFQPIALYRAQAGDQIVAHLALHGGRWHLSIVDSTSGAKARFSTPEQADARFALALWVQEDVTNAATGGPLPYPQLGQVRFRRLRVDARRPASRSLRPQLMSLPGRYLRPSRVRDDGFRIRRRAIGRRAAAYLRIVDAERAASERFRARVLSWSQSTPRAAIVRACEAISRTLAGSVSALQSTRWPPAARPKIAVLVRRLRYLLDHTRSPPRATGLVGYRLDFEGEAILADDAATGVERALRLPIPRGLTFG